MKKIDYIFKVWSDLDTYYSKVASKMSKRTYLEKLIGYNQQAKTSSFLENYVADEVDTYSQEEYTIYERMLMLFKQMFDKLRVASDDIVDFGSFLSQDIHSYNDEDVSLYRKDASISPERLHELGYFMDAVIMENGKPRAYTVKETDDYRVFYNTSDLAVFLNSEEDFVSELLDDFDDEEPAPVVRTVEDDMLDLLDDLDNEDVANNDSFIASNSSPDNEDLQKMDLGFESKASHAPERSSYLTRILSNFGG